MLVYQVGKIFKTLVILLFGGLLGWILGLVTRPTTGEHRGDRGDVGFAGISYLFGDEARRAAKIAGIAIPDEGTDVFYGIGGIKPVRECVAFTLPSGILWSSLEAMCGKIKSEFKEQLLLRGIGFFQESAAKTLLFQPQPSTLDRGINWNPKPELRGECVVDEAIGRVFVTIEG